MKFEKISDKKFAAFKQSEVVNPILISGGSIPTSGVSTHDRIGDTQAGQTDEFQSTANGSDFTQDSATTADHSDID